MGCGPSERNTGVEKGDRAPKSSLTYEEGLQHASVAALYNGWLYGRISNTGSMEPQLDSGCIGLYEECDGSDIKVGQVVVFVREDKHVLHKVLEVNNYAFIAGGVANSTNDGWIPRNSVVRRLVGVIYTEGQL